MNTVEQPGDEPAIPELPDGFTTFDVTQHLPAPLITKDGISQESLTLHFGTGYEAQLPLGGKITITPGDWQTWTAPGFFLAVYDEADRWRYGQHFGAIGSALREGRATLAKEQRLAGLDRRPWVGEGVDGCLRSAAIDRSEADTLDRDDPRQVQLEDSARAWETQAKRLQASEAGRDEHATRSMADPGASAEPETPDVAARRRLSRHPGHRAAGTDAPDRPIEGNPRPQSR